MEQDWIERLQQLADRLAWLQTNGGGDAWIVNAMIAVCSKAKIHNSFDFNKFMDGDKHA